MATYSNIGIKLITTGDESGTWGTSTNTNFSDVLDEAIAGAVTYNISSDADFTLTVSDGTSSDARHAVIKFTSTTLTATRVCTFAPNDLQKTWVVINSTTGGQSLTFKQGSAGGTVTVPNGESAIIYSDGGGSSAGAVTRVLDSFTNTKITTGTLNATTLDLTNLEVTNIKAKDGTSAASIADSTGVVSITANPILSGGTANGVLYLNGSKVATSGSALTFDGTNLGVGANITASAAGAPSFTVGTGSGSPAISLYSSTTGASQISFADATSGSGAYDGYLLYNQNSQYMAFGAAAAEQMRLTSTGLGIGTTSPSTKVHSKASNNQYLAEDASGNVFYVQNTGGEVALNAYLSTTARMPIVFKQYTTEIARFDSSGNLGIGTTSPSYKLHVLSGSSANTVFLNNTAGSAYSATSFFSGSMLTLQSGSNASGNATAIRFASGNNGSLEAMFGVAQNASTYADFVWQSYNGSYGERMRLDSSGNLGIGTTSPTQRLQVNGSSAAILITGVTNTSGMQLGVREDGNDVQVLNVANAALRFGTNATERARITAGGALAVGLTTPTFADGNGIHLNNSSGAARFHVTNNTTGTTATDGSEFTVAGSDLYIINNESATMQFWTSAAERGRFTAGGYFKASNDGTYGGATGVYHELRNNANDRTVFISNTIASGYTDAITQISFTAYAPNTTTSWFLYCNDTTAQRAAIRSNGGLANYQANDVNLSDQRVKKDIKPLGSMWDKFKALEIVTFKYKDQTHDDDNIGVIAQQVESVAPEFIDTDGFGNTPEGEEPLKTVYTTDMYHAAIKALQEAMARIEKLEAEVAAMKGVA